MALVVLMNQCRVVSHASQYHCHAPEHAVFNVANQRAASIWLLWHVAKYFDAMGIENLDGPVVRKCLNSNQNEQYVKNTKNVTV